MLWCPFGTWCALPKCVSPDLEWGQNSRKWFQWDSSFGQCNRVTWSVSLCCCAVFSRIQIQHSWGLFRQHKFCSVKGDFYCSCFTLGWLGVIELMRLGTHWDCCHVIWMNISKHHPMPFALAVSLINNNNNKICIACLLFEADWIKKNEPVSEYRSPFRWRKHSKSACYDISLFRLVPNKVANNVICQEHHTLDILTLAFSY